MKKRWPRMFAAAAALLAGLAWHAAQHRSTGPDAGTQIGGAETLVRGSKSRAAPRLRLATWNIHGGTGADGRRDLERISAQLGTFDFAALQELRGSDVFASSNQAEWLGRRLGAAWLFAPAMRQWYARTAGNGFLTRLPVRFWQRLPLPQIDDYSHRNMVLAELQTTDRRGTPRTVRVVITHIQRRHDRERQAQLRMATELFQSLEPPVVLLGDLNTTADDPQMRALCAAPDVLDPLAASTAPNNANRIDWILARGMRSCAADMVETDASDHPLVWAELEIADEADASQMVRNGVTPRGG